MTVALVFLGLSLNTVFFHLTYSGSSAKRSYVIPLVVAIAVFAVFVAIIGFVLKTRLQRQRNGRMKLTEHHADTLPHPYPEEKTFENPIYQVSEHLTKHRQHCHPSLSPTHPPPLRRPSLGYEVRSQSHTSGTFHSLCLDNLFERCNGPDAC